jgi:GAF domain-containing protein
MAVPLVAAGEVTGVLTVYWAAPRQLSADEEAFTTAVSGYAAQAVARARLFEAERTARSRLPIRDDIAVTCIDLNGPAVTPDAGDQCAHRTSRGPRGRAERCR